MLYKEMQHLLQKKMRSNSWLMFMHQVPARPSTLRVGTWRKLKILGAVYLQHSLCVLPNNPDLKRTLDELKGEIEASKGEARISIIRMEDPAEHKELAKRFQAQSDEEYEEFLGQCRDFHKELDHERSTKHFTFAELDENDAELSKLRTWLVKIGGRDFFYGKLADKATKAFQACERDLARFSKEVESKQSELAVPIKRSISTKRTHKSA